MKSHQRPPGKSTFSSHKPPPSSSKHSHHHHQHQHQQPPPLSSRHNSSPDPRPSSATRKPPSSSDAKPSPTGNLNALHSPSSRFPPSSSSSAPPPPAAYGFHMLERRTIVLADGSVRSYFALPSDYPMDPSTDRFFPYGAPVPGIHQPEPPLWSSSPPPSSLKRKLDDDSGDFARRHVARYGNPNGLPLSPPRAAADERFLKHAKLTDGLPSKEDDEGEPVNLDEDPEDLQKAYLKYAKLIHESPAQKKKYLDNGKGGNVSCAVCGGRFEELPF